MFDEPDRRLAEIAAGQHGIFTRADAKRAGLSPQQMERRLGHAWESVHKGVYRLRGVPPTWRGDLFAACAVATRPAGISRRAAAAFYELPGGREGLVEITCRRWNRTQSDGIVVHESTRLDDHDVVVIDGIAVVTPERVILELAGIYKSVNFTEKAIQAARRKRLVTYDSALETFNRLARRGLPGVKVMRAALDRWDRLSRPTDSDMETWLVQTLREHGLPEPVTQYVIRDEFGHIIGRADAALPEFKITFEYQSDQEHSNEFQLAKDDRRRNAIIAAGYFPLAARYADLRNGGHILVAEVKRLMRRAAS